MSNTYIYKVITKPVDEAAEFNDDLEDALQDGFTLLNLTYDRSVSIISGPRSVVPWFYVTLIKNREDE